MAENKSMSKKERVKERIKFYAKKGNDPTTLGRPEKEYD